ncbi:MAG: hypothetical protein KGH66_02680 [Candidatus Micrarchaeota archaeon]|nr:hypothetical protein [Candidatus Micrarchaeota archaeon]
MAPDPMNPSVRDETKTSIDTLVDLLKSRGKMELNAIATALGVDSNLVESWAKVLENGGLVKIDYEVGKMYLEPLGVSKETIPNIKSKMTAQEQAIEQGISADKISIDKYVSALENLSGQVSGVEAEYKKRMPEIQQMIGELNKAYASVGATEKSIDEIKKSAESAYAGLSKRIGELNTSMSSFGGTNSDASIGQSVERLNALRQKAVDTEKTIAEIEKNKNRAFDTIMKSIDSEVKEIRRQITDANKDIETQLSANKAEMESVLKYIQGQNSEAKRLSDQLKGFKGEQESYRKSMETISNEARDKFSRLNDQLEKDIHIIDENSKAMTQKLDSVKGIFGGVNNFDQALKNARSEIDGLRKEAVATKTEIEELAGQLRAFKSMSNLTLDKSMDMMGKLAKQAKASGAKVSGLKDGLADVKKKIDDDSKGL